MIALSNAVMQEKRDAPMQDLGDEVVENFSPPANVTFGPVADRLIRLQPLNPLCPITIKILPRDAQ